MEHLELLSVLSPGLTENRAHMAFRYAETLFWSLKRNLLSCSSQEAISLIKDSLDVVVDTFGDYKQGSSENDKSLDALSLLQRSKSEIYD